ncbi:DUF4178 domain-containing protein [bacterium]|nr:DUF4178 domain-containing protein [bacterium]
MKLRAVKCPGCGSSARLRDGAESGFCTNCGGPITLEQALAAERKGLKEYPNETIVNPGMKATRNAKAYEVIGRIVVGMEEEGETYLWDEFELVAADGDAMFLEFDEGSWKLMETFTPNTPIGPDEIAGLHIGSSVSMDGRTYNVTQISVSTVHFVQGELTYAASVDDKASYMDAQHGNNLLTVEWKEDEIEFYRGRFLTERQVYEIFGRHDLIQAQKVKTEKAKHRAVFASICMALAILAFILSGILSSLGKQIYSQQTTFDAIPAEGARFGPVRLRPDQRYRLKLDSGLREASAWAVGVVESADGIELFANEHDFWDESGSDSDGAWHESDLAFSRDFVVDKEEDYYVRLYMEKDPPLNANTPVFQHVGFSILEGVYGVSYLAMYGILGFMTAVLFYIRAFASFAAGQSK